MANYNKIFLLGRLTRNPEKRQAGTGYVTDIGLAVNDRWRDKQGEWKEDVLFVDGFCFGHTANSIALHCIKGDLILIEGKLRLQQWTSRDGQNRQKHCVQIFSYQRLSRYYLPVH